MNNRLINIKEYGKGKNLILFSPFLPFDNGFFENFFLNLDLENTKLAFTTLTNFDFDTNYINNITEEYLAYLRLNIEFEKVQLIGFGFYSLIISNLFCIYNKYITNVLFFEPDFSNSTLNKIFETKNAPVFKVKYLFNFYSNCNINHKNMGKINIKRLKAFYYLNKTYFESKKILKDLFSHAEKISIFWNIMEKESWPLPQILSEEYNFHVINTKESIISCFNNKDIYFEKEIKNILNNS